MPTPRSYPFILLLFQFCSGCPVSGGHWDAANPLKIWEFLEYIVRIKVIRLMNWSVISQSELQFEFPK